MKLDFFSILKFSSLVHLAGTFFIVIFCLPFFVVQKAISLSFIYSILAGSGLVGVSFIILIWCGIQFLEKKPSFVLIGILVFKYIILAGLIFYFLQKNWFNLWGFLLGLLSLIPSLGAFWHRFGKD